MTVSRHDERGVGAIEMALLLVGVALVVFGASRVLGQGSTHELSEARCGIDGEHCGGGAREGANFGSGSSGGINSNASFETDSNADGLSDGWSVWSRGRSDFDRKHTAERTAALTEGGWAQRVNIDEPTNGNYSALSSYYGTVTPGETFTVTGVGIANQPGRVQISIRWSTSTGGYVGDVFSQDAFGTDSSTISVTATAPERAGRMHVVVNYRSPETGDWFEVDDFAVEKS